MGWPWTATRLCWDVRLHASCKLPQPAFSQDMLFSLLTLPSTSNFLFSRLFPKHFAGYVLGSYPSRGLSWSHQCNDYLQISLHRAVESPEEGPVSLSPLYLTQSLAMGWGGCASQALRNGDLLKLLHRKTVYYKNSCYSNGGRNLTEPQEELLFLHQAPCWEQVLSLLQSLRRS